MTDGGRISHSIYDLLDDAQLSARQTNSDLSPESASSREGFFLHLEMSEEVGVGSCFALWLHTIFFFASFANFWPPSREPYYAPEVFRKCLRFFRLANATQLDSRDRSDSFGRAPDVPEDSSRAARRHISHLTQQTRAGCLKPD